MHQQSAAFSAQRKNNISPQTNPKTATAGSAFLEPEKPIAVITQINFSLVDANKAIATKNKGSPQNEKRAKRTYFVGGGGAIVNRKNPSGILKIGDLLRRGAEGGNRTLTVLLPHDFESCASTNSATSAYVLKCIVYLLI